MEEGTMIMVDGGGGCRGVVRLQSSRMIQLLLLSILITLLTPGVNSEQVRHLEVSENAPPGSRVGFIDIEGPPYLIVPVSGSPVISDLTVDPATGEIKTRLPLDRETNPSYSFVALPQRGNIRVVIKVLDENDNAPTFPVDHVDIEFPENSPRDAKRALPPAKDPDLGQYSTQRYEIVSGNYGDVFRLTQHRGRDGVLYLDLQNSGNLDREARSSYQLIVEALDGGSPPLRSRLRVNVIVQDVNDNPPIFNQTRYTASVPENATVGTPVLQVNATDSDTGNNGRIEYSINRRQSDREEMFRIDSGTGMVYVNKALDFESKERHELVIVARDLGAQPLEASAFLSVYVTDVNDNQPTITVIFLSDDATPKISESAQPGEFVARISVSDPDSRTEYSNATVTLTGGDGHFGLATRDNIIYLVVVERPLDREEKPIYDLSVEATDAGTPPLRAIRTFRLLVTDVNDNAPSFEQEHYEAHLLEASEPGTAVIKVKATDVDEGVNSVIKYSLKNSTWFSIDEDTGLISTVTHVDCETDPSPNLVVIATDTGRPSLSGTAIVRVTVHDLNDNEPIFEKPLYNTSVPEDLPVGRCFIKVQATDPDCGVNSMVNYTLAAGRLASEQLFVRSDSGEICVRSALDREVASYLELPVIATDRGGLSTTAIVRIQVLDVNDNRPIFNPRDYNTTIRSDAPPSDTIVRVIATDVDAGLFGQVAYRISGGNEAGLFRIDRVTGELQVARPSLLGRSAVHLLNVTATDAGGLKNLLDARVRVSVSAGQRLPICERPRYAISARENVLQNSIIGDVKEAIVGDAPGAAATGKRPSRFFLATGENEFSIDPSSGVLRTRIPFDRETRDKYVLSVGIRNNIGIGYCQVELTVEDVNDNPPTFPSTNVRISVPESHPLRTALYIAHATDPDRTPSAPVRYQLGQNSNDLFGIDTHTGELYLSRRLDYETQQRHNLMISAVDGAGLSANITLSVEVQDVNDNPPVFERNEYHVEIPEGAKLDSQVLQVTALDLDTGNNARISYRLKGSTLFRISPNTGWIYLKQSLDRETTDHYSLTVLATDNGSPAATASSMVLITVLDDNDNSPHFVKDFYTFELLENLPSGTVVGSISAVDPDLGRNALLRYTVVQHNSSFAIDPDTGEIITREPLDRETKSVHELVLEARDQGTPSRAARVPLRVTVLDVNDNSPEIVDPQGDVVSVREEQPPGTEVARVRALDSDLGENATITYSILKDRDSDGYNVFTIDPITGMIRTKSVLDHEERDVYRVSVKASDAGRPPRHSIRALRVEVLALADNRPTFTSSSLTFHVREDATIGQSIGSVSGAGPAGRVAYTLDSLAPVTTTPAFDVDRSSGQLVVAHSLDRENVSEYHLKIRALDTTSIGNPQSIAVSVKIIIDDANDNAPRWPLDPIYIRVSEAATIGTTIYNLTATDLDSGMNGDLRYDLVSEFPVSGSFAVDSLTGALSLIKPLDREEKTEYTLFLRATDRAPLAERLSSTVTAKIIVLDQNDNDPAFVAPEINKITVTTDLLPGTNIVRVIAVDKDTDNNGRVSYVITSGNEDSRFSLGYDSGILTLMKPIVRDTVLQIAANDHGSPPRRSIMNLTVSIAVGQTSGPPRLLLPNPAATISENLVVGGFIINVVGSTLSEQVNVTFDIPAGIADDKFRISSTGVVTLAAPLDREKNQRYHIPILAKSTKLLDLTTLEITVQDENDNAPEFRPGSCYTLAVPENQDAAIIHTVAAMDIDEGVNGEISYSIIGGNIGGKFKLDPVTGHLSAFNLDRESVARYNLAISAKDKGRPSLETHCNITVIVIDVNDNPPVFLRDQYRHPSKDYNFNPQSPQYQYTNTYPHYVADKYIATISEDTAPDSSVLSVRATDPDQGVNGKITYVIAEETSWLFRVDNFTGVITTAGPLDRECQSTFNFMVIATDSGSYDAKSTSIPIEINLTDINDNAPVFTETPFKATVPVTTQPGHTIIQVKAKDPDAGLNGEITYAFLNDNEKSKFRIHQNSGVLTATTSLTQDFGKTYHLEIIARDKGTPSKSSRGLIELRIGDPDDVTSMLKFQNYSYEVDVQENSASGKEILQVTAVRTDGRRQHVVYSIASGNDFDTFVIDPDTGMVKINDPAKLDAEMWIDADEEGKEFWKNENRGQSRRILTLVAKTTGTEPLEAYAKLTVHITDVNDNAPIFTQTQYSATVLEGNAKGNFVVKLSASDADQDTNGKILYHIVDGNPDNAFTISPPYSGIVRTNIVLDREIREKYRLTIIATDQGNPQLTGTTALSVRVIDINDNQPTFPGHNVISVPEGTAVGTVLTTITANDVDSSPALTYRFGNVNHPTPFSIDRYGGKVTLTESLDAEDSDEYTIQVIASDGIHEAITDLTVRIVDVNDNQPKFQQAAYIATLSEGRGEVRELLTVNATDDDLLQENNVVHYHLLNPVKGFSINSETGVITANRTALLRPLPKEIELIIVARDSGKPALSSTCTVIVRLSGLRNASSNREFKINVNENAARGTSLLKLADLGLLDGTIVSQEGSDVFETSRGRLIISKNLDREFKDRYIVYLGTKSENSSSITNDDVVIVTIQVDDANDNYPHFTEELQEVSIKEDAAIGTLLTTIRASDNDLAGTPAATIAYNITSGNDRHLFQIDPSTGAITVNSTLDCDLSPETHHLVILACDTDILALCSLARVRIHIEDVNDNSPKFPVHEYLEFVGENEPVGTKVFSARASDLDRGVFGTVNYSIVSAAASGFTDIDDSWKLFNVNAQTGAVTTGAIFDYEQRNRYAFTLRATDAGGRTAAVKVRVEIDSRDEFYPQFTERMYRFDLRNGLQTQPGTVVGQVTATDRDKGPDGRVVYQLTSQHPYFKLNRTTGALIVKKKLHYDTVEESSRLVVSASSGRQRSLSNMTVVEIRIIDDDSNSIFSTNYATSTNLGANMAVATSNGLADWALGLLIALVLLIAAFGGFFLYVHLKNRKHKKPNAKPGLNGDGNATASNSYVDPTAFDTIPIRGVAGVASNVNAAGNAGSCQFAPPKYDEIPPYGTSGQSVGQQATSEISGSDQSGSSGRGSAEDDGEDEEIRMINEGQAADSASDLSVHNTQEYLARLGIVDAPSANSHSHARRPPEALPLESIHLFEDEAVTEAEIATLIYGKIGETRRPTSELEVPGGPSMNGSLSSIVHSEEELTGSYNWDYLLDWGPQYQPLAHVFSEIARLKDDAASVQSGNSANRHKVQQHKAPPPPLLTSVAPRSIAAPALARAMLPRSPISHDASTFPSAALSPSFSPSLSPLATRSPSISPLVPPTPQRAQNPRSLPVVDNELRI
ncbi:protein dachsous isoform X1 [Microplitis demolitor]|uniref:protein dachsous isoform X1 n=2 Tax=Microplitis demolitor TaxID=69319 RepID=UPI0004CD878E|nr:protein dachsous isoform X1 [Microplitis demolitor]